MEKHLLLNKLYRKKENKFIKKVVILAITTFPECRQTPRFF